MNERAELDARADPEPEGPATAQHLPRWAIGAAVGAVVVGAVVLARVYGIGESILLLAAGALVLVVTFVFRALQSIAEPSDEDILAELAPTFADERKRSALRALREIEYERTLGKLNENDFTDLSAHYRQEAKRAMRAVDEERRELRARAERLATAALQARAIADRAKADDSDDGADAHDEDPAPAQAADADADSPPPAAEPPVTTTERRACPKCAIANDPDARFCKACGTTLEVAP